MPGEPITSRGRASRERIVERAAELFAERGIAATSVDEVLAAAGAGKGQFYHYFRGRDELTAAAVGYRCAQAVAGLTQALGGVSSLPELEQALAGFVTGFEQTGLPGCPIGTLATEVAGRNEAARLQAAAGFDAWERLLADALERMRQRGELRADASPAVLATGLLASIEGGMVLSQARRDIASLHVAVEAGLGQVRACLRVTGQPGRPGGRGGAERR
jgi:TetR/AcrR family transcriptional regulator, transcriptional repressor for nem operon